MADPSPGTVGAGVILYKLPTKSDLAVQARGLVWGTDIMPVVWRVGRVVGTHRLNRWAYGCPKMAQNGSSLVLPPTNSLANLLEPKV